MLVRPQEGPSGSSLKLFYFMFYFKIVLVLQLYFRPPRSGCVFPKPILKTRVNHLTANHRIIDEIDISVASLGVLSLQNSFSMAEPLDRVWSNHALQANLLLQSITTTQDAQLFEVIFTRRGPIHGNALFEHHQCGPKLFVLAAVCDKRSIAKQIQRLSLFFHPLLEG